MHIGGFFKKLPLFWDKYKRYKKNRRYRYRFKELKNKMKINIISDKESGWILYKFSKCVVDELTELGYDATLSYEFDASADINHYFTPNNVGANRHMKVDDHTTFMVTHVDTVQKLDLIRELTKAGAIGVCMSLDTRDKMIESGVDNGKICYINPAQDGMIRPKKVSLGFMHRVYNDNRKRESMLLDICKQISPQIFKFVIMGAGWDAIIAEMNGMGFETEYYPEFDKIKYNELIRDLDYYCYFGTDEGSMGYLDAVAAGIGTIVTPQGYHLDSGVKITYPVNTINDIVDALHEISAEKERSIRFAEEWTWKAYTLKHLEIWKYMLHCETLESLLSNRGKYIDGIFSLMLSDLEYYVSLKDAIKKNLN